MAIGSRQSSPVVTGAGAPVHGPTIPMPVDARPRPDHHGHVTDAEDPLVQRARTGDAAAIEQLIATHLPALRAYVRLHLPAALREQESHTDVVQSVCVEILQHEGSFEYRGPEAFRGWLYTWARRKIQDRSRYWRAEKRALGKRTDVAADESLGALAGVYRGLASPSADAVRNEDVLRLEAAMERLPDDYREVIGLCRIAGLSREEAGARMGGRAPGAVRMLLSRALVALSHELERERSRPLPDSSA